MYFTVHWIIGIWKFAKIKILKDLRMKIFPSHLRAFLNPTWHSPTCSSSLFSILYYSTFRICGKKVDISVSVDVSSVEWGTESCRRIPIFSHFQCRNTKIVNSGISCSAFFSITYFSQFTSICWTIHILRNKCRGETIHCTIWKHLRRLNEDRICFAFVYTRSCVCEWYVNSGVTASKLNEQLM